ncbi:signal peptidase I [Longispora albida]|uniref:signal peptidase I n=1 Tax=Longispora albida TaxID=203523 RepID=UPI001FE0198C|nr:signal peptidase I [Longispora albida]
MRDKRRAMPWWQELPLLLVIALCLAILLRTFFVQAFYIPSGSMEDTLQVGDKVLVNKIVYDFWKPERGEIVVFRGDGKWAPEVVKSEEPGFFGRIGRGFGDLVGVSEPGEKDFIKRIIGIPGDVVACCDAEGRVTVNGFPLNEPYVKNNSLLEDPQPGRECRSRKFAKVIVQPGHVFVMGDHRAVSQDSRCNGQVPIKSIIGRAGVIALPVGRWGSLTVPDTFDGVPVAWARNREDGRGL